MNKGADEPVSRERKDSKVHREAEIGEREHELVAPLGLPAPTFATFPKAQEHSHPWLS